MSAYQRALSILGGHQRAYQSVFADGAPGHQALVELADYARAFTPDDEGINPDTVMQMHGRRQAFFHILNHLKLSQPEIEIVYRKVLLRGAARLNASQGAEE